MYMSCIVHVYTCIYACICNYVHVYVYTCICVLVNILFIIIILIFEYSLSQMKQSRPSHLKVEDTSYGISTSSSSSSLRHSKRSYRQTSIDDHRSSISSLIDALPKPRPPLSADLFIKPHKQETGQTLTEEKEFWSSSTHNENDDLLDIISSGDENIVDIKKEEDLSNDKMIDIVVTDVDEDIIETPNSDVDTEHAVIPISKVFLPDENTTERTLHVDEEDDEILEIREDEEVMIGMLVEGEREKDIPARKRRPTLWERLGLKRRSSSKSTNSKVKSRDTSKILNGVTQPVVKNVSQEVDRGSVIITCTCYYLIIHVYICTYIVHINIYMYTYIHTYRHTYIYTYIHTCTYIHTYTCTYIHT